MPAASAARPISPSSASTSRTRCPLPTPPMAGLQDISPRVATLWVSSKVRAPQRAAAAAASQPAWPPPTTTTSKIASNMLRGIADPAAPTKLPDAGSQRVQPHVLREARRLDQFQRVHLAARHHLTEAGQHRLVQHR